MHLQDLMQCTRQLQKTSSRNKKIDIIISFLKRLSAREIEPGVHFIAGKIRQGKLNVGWKILSSLSKTAAKQGKQVSVHELDTVLDAVKSARGSKKETILRPVFERMNADLRDYVIGLIFGEVHQGAGEGLVKMAIARASGLGTEAIEQIYLRNPDIGKLYAGLQEKGPSIASRTDIVLFRPMKPMLAQVSESIEKVYEECDDTAVEHKLDGVRIQIHRDKDDVRIFSRNLKDMTERFPDIIAVVQSLPVKQCILDGEAVGLDKKGRVIPFQTLARRTTRKAQIQEFMENIPVIPQFFDLLYLDGEDITMKTYRERMRMLDMVVPDKKYRVRRMMPKNTDRAAEFFTESISAGNEGIVIKLLDSRYRPGKRGKLWFKIKHTDTIDCVILAAEWGYGRRTGRLSNLHLGVLDETGIKYCMVGKTFKGLTDQMLQWFTDNLPRYAVHKDRWTVYVKPAVVVEIAYNGVLTSTKYDSGYSLRFARVKRIRHDKKPSQINSVIDIQKLSRRTSPF
ncbi:MAG: ATP-dependent DNA ligase [candidate division WOR-3 bacterium]|nr:MAG: ATP-dependent DNA ligase [candidate division WOR-3 bacterium]